MCGPSARKRCASPSPCACSATPGQRRPRDFRCGAPRRERAGFGRAVDFDHRDPPRDLGRARERRRQAHGGCDDACRPGRGAAACSGARMCIGVVIHHAGRPHSRSAFSRSAASRGVCACTGTPAATAASPCSRGRTCAAGGTLPTMASAGSRVPAEGCRKQTSAAAKLSPDLGVRRGFAGAARREQDRRDGIGIDLRGISNRPGARSSRKGASARQRSPASLHSRSARRLPGIAAAAPSRPRVRGRAAAATPGRP